jgi:hypothetical protein
MNVQNAINEVYRCSLGDDNRRPYCMLKLLKEHQTWNDEQRDEFIGEFWAYTNNPSSHVSTWIEIFNYYPKAINAKHNLNRNEILTVYRGADRIGFSWTQSKKIAAFFAKRNIEFGDTNSVVFRAEIYRHGIIFESEARLESEIVLRFWDESIWYSKPIKIDFY